jgi:methylenetetrahydrofolate dehydrogenase (NADP+)/methenyltetrahydrofolate cyclohydrolase
MTTGKPIASYFDSFAIPYEQTHSATADPDSIYRQSDIIICGVGKKILTRENIKKGVILLNFGLQKREHRVMVRQAHHDTDTTEMVQTKQFLFGDYDEDEIRDIASWYTITPGGLGPIDILCLYGNLIESATHILETRDPP